MTATTKKMNEASRSRSTTTTTTTAKKALFPLLALALLAAACAPTARAYTDPEHVKILLQAKESLSARGPNWRAALASWTCPSGISSCDPCGSDFWGLWNGIGCRGSGVSSEDRRGGGGDGRVTNLHFTKSGGEGPGLPVEEFCALGGSVKEFDLTVGDTGSAATPSPPVSVLPAAVATCWPNLHKMKASFNSISGEIPAWLGSMKKLSYIKIRNNKLSGTIPQELAASPALFYLDAADNGLGGAVPQFGEKLGVLDVSGNGKLTGPIDKALGSAVGLQVVGLKNNPGLCGPVPSSARWAVGFSAEGTGLGKPCGGASSNSSAPSSSSSTPEKKET